MKGWSATWRRIRALTLKETRQVIRDPSSIAIGCVVPLLMILLFGYGLSLDIKHVSVAVLDEDDSSDGAALIGAFRLSPYFQVTAVHSMTEANTRMLDRTVDGVLRIQSDFARRRRLGGAKVQILPGAGIWVGQKSRFWSMARTRTRRASCKAMPRGQSPSGARRRLDQGAPRPPARLLLLTRCGSTKTTTAIISWSRA